MTFPFIGQSSYATVLFLYQTSANFAQGLCLDYPTIPSMVRHMGSWDTCNFKPFKGKITIGEQFTITIEKLT